VVNPEKFNLRPNLLARFALPSIAPGRKNLRPMAELSSALANRMITIP
jgi:hypothetical protein